MDTVRLWKWYRGRPLHKKIAKIYAIKQKAAIVSLFTLGVMRAFYGLTVHLMIVLRGEGYSILQFALHILLLGGLFAPTLGAG